MEYTTIFVLKNDKGHLILERPREFVGVVLRGLDGEYHRTNLKDLHVGYEKVGEVLPLKGDNEDSAYVYINGELIEVNPSSPNFEELVANDDKYKNAISVLANIYNKINNNLEVEEITIDDDSIELGDDIDEVLNEESNISGLSDEHSEDSKLVATGEILVQETLTNLDDSNDDVVLEDVKEPLEKKEDVKPKAQVKKTTTSAKVKGKPIRGRSKTTRKNG